MTKKKKTFGCDSIYNYMFCLVKNRIKLNRLSVNETNVEFPVQESFLIYYISVISKGVTYFIHS